MLEKNKFSVMSLINVIEEWVLAGSVFIMAVVLIGNVLSRTIWGQSWYFAEEVGQTLTVAITFLGLGYATKHNKHVNMSAILDLVDESKRRLMEMAILITTAVFSLLVAYLALKYSMRVNELGRVTAALRTPYYITTGFVAIGFFLCFVENINKFISLLYRR